MEDFAGREKSSGSLSKVLDQHGASAGHDHFFRKSDLTVVWI